MKDISQRMMETSEDTDLGMTKAASIAANGSCRKKGEQMKERKKLYEKRM